MPKKGNLDKRPIPEDSSRAVEYLQERLKAYTGKSRIIDRVLAPLSRLLSSTQTEADACPVKPNAAGEFSGSPPAAVLTACDEKRPMNIKTCAFVLGGAFLI
jgi:hypothetical protein